MSALSDETARNQVKGVYDPKKAEHKAYVRRKYAKYQGMTIVKHPRIRTFVEEKLYDDQSPEAIAGRLKKREKKLKYVSKNSIYRYVKSVYGRKIEARRTRKKKQRTNRRKRAKIKLSDRTFIDKRPVSIEKRRHVGDVEADFIVSGRSGKGILLVVVDRKTRVSFLERISCVTIENMNRAFLHIKKRFPEMRTATTDNDILFQKHKELEILLSITIYFCHPYHSWEKGSVENTNKYIRKDVPKGSSLATYSKAFIRNVENKLNRRILKCLDYHTPYEVLTKWRKQKKRRSDYKQKKK